MQPEFHLLKVNKNDIRVRSYLLKIMNLDTGKRLTIFGEKALALGGYLLKVNKTYSKQAKSFKSYLNIAYCQITHDTSYVFEIGHYNESDSQVFIAYYRR